MELRELAEKEIGKMEEVIEAVEIMDDKGKDVLDLAKTYFNDSKHFLDKEDFIRAFEAVVISWAYIDAGLHLKVFEIPDSMKEMFTVE